MSLSNNIDGLLGYTVYQVLNTSLEADGQTTENMTSPSTVQPQPTAFMMEDCTTFNFIYDFILIGSLCTLGFLGNTISILVLSKDHFSKVTLFLFISLAVVDNSVLVISFILLSVIYGLLPYAQAEMMTKHAVPFLVKYIHPLAYISHCCTIWITVLLASYRFIAVCQPFNVNKWCTLRRARIQVATIVIVAICFNLPRFFQFEIEKRSHFDRRANTTVVSYNLKETPIGEHQTFGKIYTNLLYTIIAVLTPLVILVILNSRLIAEIRKVKNRAKQNGLPQLEDDNISLIMVVIIVMVLVCHTPDRILELVSFFINGYNACGTASFYVLNVCNLLMIINSSANFVIYFLLRKGFRKILFKRLCFFWSNNEDEDKTSNELLPLGKQSKSNSDFNTLKKTNGYTEEVGPDYTRNYSV